MKKFLELSIVIWLLSFLIYFLLYMFYFENMCNNIKKDPKWDYLISISYIWKCKWSLVCEVSWIKTNKQNIITDWQCDKKVNNSLEFNYYMNKISDLYNNTLDKFNKNDKN